MDDVGKGFKDAMEKKDYMSRYDHVMKEVLGDVDVKQFIQENRDYLKDQDIAKSYAKLYEFVQEKKKFLAQSDTMIAPGYEPKLVLNFHYIDVAYVPTEALLVQQKEEEIRRRVRAVDMPKDVREASLAKFEVTPERSLALTEALDFIDVYLENPKGYHKALYLQGSFGVGKTYLLGAIAHELAIKGYETTLIHFPTFAVEMKQAIGKDNVGEKLNIMKKAPILMIDDIGADSMSSWIRDEVLGVILQYRMQEELPTFFSSNFSMKQLEEEHLSVTQKGDQEPLKARRIMERIRYLAKEVSMVGKNRRNG